MAEMNSEELTEMKWQDVFVLSDEMREQIENGHTDIDTTPFESEIILPDNRKRDALMTISPILFYGKRAVIFSIKDISSDILLKRKLHESRERFKALMDKLNAGIFRTTLDSRGRFIEANETVLQLLGFEEGEQLKGKYIIVFFAEEEDKRNFRNKLLESGFVRNQVIRLLKSNGSIVHAMVSLAVIADDVGVAAWCDGIIEPVNAINSAAAGAGTVINLEELRAMLLNMNTERFVRPLQAVPHGYSITEAAHLMNSLDRRYLLVTDQESNILGYVTDHQLAVVMTVDQNSDATSGVYSVMNALVPIISLSSTMIDARKKFRETNSDLLLVIGEQKKPVGVICSTDLIETDEMKIIRLLAEMTEPRSVDSLKKVRKEFVYIIASLVTHNIHYSVVLQLLSEAFDAVTRCLFELAFKEMGTPPVDFAMIVMGSEGRKEQTLSTDQDHAFIIDDSEGMSQEVSDWFLRLGKWMSLALNEVGYRLCKGDNMALNPKWNQPLSVWKNYFTTWINNGQSKVLLEINIFFNFCLCYGKKELPESLQSHISETSSMNPAYLHHLARNTVQARLTVGEVHDIKDTVAAIVNFARIYALQQGINEKNTVQRFEKLVEAGVMKENSVAEGRKALEFHTGLRLRHQAKRILNDEPPDNQIQAKQLTEFEQAVLKKAVSTISAMLSKLNFDFRLGI